ncbi:MAG: cell division protein FtsA [Acidobacteria bacterium]|nr:cell division protein FtsA [Acidobacteriota bacterium]
MKIKERIIWGLDVGTWKTCLVAVRLHRDGKLEILASGFANSSGLAKGVIVDPAEVVDSIRQAAEEAKSASRITPNRAIVGITGAHVKSHSFHGSVPIQGKHGEITEKDMENAILAASIPLFPDQDIIHILPQEFCVNGYKGIKNPVGLTGSQLEVNLHVISCNSALCQSLINAVNKARIEVKRVVLQAIASGEAVLTPAEKELGVAVIDIGGGTTDIAVFVKDSVSFVSVIPVGGAHFTGDLVKALHTSKEEAERIKIEHGNVLTDEINPDEMVTFQGLGLRDQVPATRKKICEILHDRGAELLEFVRDDILHSGLRENLIAGAVLTGGGSMMEGMIELAESILDMPVRRGVPIGIEGLSKELAHPVYASVIGLILLDARKGTLADFQNKPPAKRSLIDIILSFLEH